VPVSVVAWISYEQASESLYESASSQLKQIAQADSQFIQNLFDYRFMDLNYQTKAPYTIKLFNQLHSGWQQSEEPLEQYIKSHHWNNVIQLPKIFVTLHL